METSFAVVCDRLVNTGIIPLSRLVELFSSNPATILNQTEKGQIKPGFAADLTVFDLKGRFKIEEKDFRSKANNCPFIGWEGRGTIEYTIVGGNIVYRRK